MYKPVYINRYIIRIVDRKVLKNAKIGDAIVNDLDPTREPLVIGFIGNVFKETKSLEICLFKPVYIKSLKVPRKRILYFEANYDTQARYKQMKQQGLIK